MRYPWRACFAIAGLSVTGSRPAAADPPRQAQIVVSAAASLSGTLQEIARAWEAASGGRALLNLGSSSNLAQQIVEGAPVDLFISADEAQMDVVQRAGRVEPGTRVALLSNQLVIVVPFDKAAPIATPRDLAGPAFRRIAIGEPRSVPAGVYARQYLEGLHLWDALQSKLIPTGTVRVVLAAVEAGNADAGFVYRTDARTTSHVTIAFAVPIADGPAIRYAAAVVRNSTQGDAARRFLEYLTGDGARAVFERAGFIALARAPEARR